MTFEFRDRYDTELSAFPGGPHDTPTVVLYVRQSHDSASVYVPLDRVEEVVAGLRDMARQAGGQRAAVQPAGTLGAAERGFLTFALDLAADAMYSRDGFTDEDHAALDRFRRMTVEEPK